MKYFYLLILFSVINFIAWNFLGIFIILNILIFFKVIETLKDKDLMFSLFIYFSFLIVFNLSSTFWLFKVNEFKSFGIFIANSFLMLPVFIISSLIFKKNRILSFLFFIFGWILLEWIYTKWQLAWPWLNLGNALANQWYLINWYSYSGVYGGSLWILLTGLVLYLITKNIKKIYFIYLILLIILPIFSLINYFKKEENKLDNNTVMISCYIPNNNNSSNYYKTKELYKKLKDNKSDYFLTPELFYKDLFPYEFKKGENAYFFNKIIESNPNIKLIFGTEIDNFNLVKFNGISVISKNDVFFRTKKKYVPITEYTPKYLRFFNNSETYYSLNNQDDEIQIKKELNIFPLVCYESVFSNFVAEKTKHTNLIFLSTSESFLSDSDFAKKQYLNLIRIRAIENGRNIVKCSYKGISCVINNKGKIILNINKEFQTFKVETQNKNTFYQTIN